MIENTTQLKAYWDFSSRSVSLSQQSLQRLTTLYLPLIGSDALALYLQLAVNGQQKGQLNDLLDRQNISLADFDNAKKKLEACGLLDSYLQGASLTFDVKLPLSEQAFLSDDLLASFFYSLVGQDTFSQLLKKTKRDNLSPSGLKSNANFYEAFGSLHLQNVPDQDRLGRAIQTEKAPLQAVDFNFSLVEQNLKKYGVSEQEVTKEHNFILAQHLIYGFNEEQLLGLLAKSLLIDDKTIDHGLFFQQLNQYRQAGKTQPVFVLPPSPQTEPRTKLSADEQALIQAAKELRPYDFLGQLKADKGGIITSSEQKILQQLLDLGLAPEVINILIHQVLIGLESSNLPGPLSQAIADSFLQSKVKTAQDAVLSIKNRQQKQLQKRSYNKKSPLQKEKKMNYGNAQKTDNQLASEALAKYQQEKKNK
ncbi:MAG: DnaD domain protein [Oenococcus sp.]|uniref:DnaD domain protein n=1 Tax=Oenococcus sp. TaxID=1979414 RepID=UPI0039EC59FC